MLIKTVLSLISLVASGIFVHYIQNSADNIKANLRPGQLIVLESTTYPGTTREILLPCFEETGLKCGKDFFLAFSPERVDPGNEKYHTKNTPKVVGGIDAPSTEVAAAWLRPCRTAQAVPVALIQQGA